MKSLIKVFSLAVVGCMFFAGSALANQLEGNNTVTVQGRAERQITPDTAFIVIGVVTQNEKVETARQENARKIESIVRSLSAYGITNKEISTSSFDLRPVYSANNSDQRKIVAYSLENVLTVKVNDVAKIGNIIDSAFANGANRLDGVRFTAANMDNIQKELLEDAVKDGLATARLVASAGGRSVGTLLKANVGSSNSYPETRMLKAVNDAAGFSGSQVFVGNLIVSADVTLVYQLN